MRWAHLPGALLLAGSALALTGCAASQQAGEASTERVVAPAPATSTADADAVGLASLFRTDGGVMTDQAIVAALATKVYPPAKGRLAVLKLGAPYGLWLSEDQATLELTATDDLLARLRSSPRLTDAVVLPSLLAPRQMTIPALREAAARLQADSLLVYRAGRRNFQRSRAFAPAEIRAYCTVEAILLDVRTGIVTDTAVATESFSAKKTGKDLSFDETIARAEQEAIGRALGRVATDLVGYLNASPTAEASPSPSPRDAGTTVRPADLSALPAGPGASLVTPPMSPMPPRPAEATTRPTTDPVRPPGR